MVKMFVAGLVLISSALLTAARCDGGGDGGGGGYGLGVDSPVIESVEIEHTR